MCDNTGCEEDRCQVETYCEDANCDWSNGHCCDADFFWDPYAGESGECRHFDPCTPDCNPWDPNWDPLIPCDCIQSNIACCDLDGTGTYTYWWPLEIY